jgi:hypothetical protein
MPDRSRHLGRPLPAWFDEAEFGIFVELLGHGGPLAWERGDGGTRVALPVALPAGPAFSLRLRDRG